MELSTRAFVNDDTTTLSIDMVEESGTSDVREH